MGTLNKLFIIDKKSLFTIVSLNGNKHKMGFL